MNTHPDLPLPLISVEGPPAQWGAAYGAAASGPIHRNIALYHRRFATEAGLERPAVRAAGAAFRTTTAALLPRIAAALDGVAEGAGVPVEDVYALNGRSELIYGGRGAPSAPPDGRDGGCTAVGVLGTHTARGHLLLGQNWDWHPEQRDAMVLLATRDERGHSVLTLAEAGMLAKAGVNSAGVGVCVNLLGCDRDGLPDDGGAPGVPYHVLLRAALEADSLSWALRSVLRLPRNSSLNMLLGHAGAPGDPAGGEMIDLEVVPGDAGWLNPRDGLLTHANHFETAVPVRDTIVDWGGSSLFRSARARRLLADAAGAAKVTEDDLAAVLRDHAGFPSAICRHVDERDSPTDRTETVFAILLDLDARRFGIAAGPPCAHEFAWLDL
jgi:isopenicillin-N N-acyltransferase like protein